MWRTEQLLRVSKDWLKVKIIEKMMIQKAIVMVMEIVMEEKNEGISHKRVCNWPL